MSDAPKSSSAWLTLAVVLAIILKGCPTEADLAQALFRQKSWGMVISLDLILSTVILLPFMIHYRKHGLRTTGQRWKAGCVLFLVIGSFCLMTSVIIWNLFSQH